MNDDIRQKAKDYEQSTDSMKKAHIVSDLAVIHAMGERSFDQQFEKIEEVIESDINSEKKLEAIDRICNQIKDSIKKG